MRILLLILALSVPAHAQYAVGTADVTFLDPDRDDRAVPVDLYYPALAAGPDQPPAQPTGDGFAAVALGHGFQMSAGVYAWLGEALAGIGCVVAVPRTGGELFPDHQEFGLDLAFAARAVRAAGQDGASPFFGLLNGRALVMGHSMGGGASLLGLASDPSLDGAVTLAAAETNPSAISACAELDRPTLFLAGTNDCVTPPADHQVPMFQAQAAGWRTLVVLDGASHCQFAAYSFLCSLGEFCSADISRTVQQDRSWFLIEPWVRAVGLEEAGQAAVFDQRLEEATWLTYEQTGPATTDAPPADAAGLRLRGMPSPFNPRTTLRLEVPRTTSVQLWIMDARGRRVRELAAGPVTAGHHEWTWDGQDGAGRVLASGTYLARARTDLGTITTRLVLVR